MSFLSKLFRTKNSCKSTDVIFQHQSSGGLSCQNGQSLRSSIHHDSTTSDTDDDVADSRPQHAPVRGRRQAIDESNAVRRSCALTESVHRDLLDRRQDKKALCRPRRSQSFDLVHPSPSVIQGTIIESRLSTASVSSDGPGPCAELLNNYRLIQHKYRGSNCEILEAVAKKEGSEPVVIKSFKTCRITESIRERRLREIEVMKAAEAEQVPNVMRFVADVENENELCTIVQRSPGVSLIELMANSGGHISEECCKAQVAAPMLLAIAGLHKLSLVHRHLKPEHLICSKTSLTLVDFTDAADKRQHCLNSRVGDLHYMAPEVLTKPRAEDIFHQVLFQGMAEEELPQYDEKVDIFSIGVIVYEALTGMQPFLAETAKDMQAAQRDKLSSVSSEGIPNFIAQQKSMSTQAQDFLLQALELHPSKRPSAAELLQHSWLHSQ